MANYHICETLFERISKAKTQLEWDIARMKEIKYWGEVKDAQQMYVSNVYDGTVLNNKQRTKDTNTASNTRFHFPKTKKLFNNSNVGSLLGL